MKLALRFLMAAHLAWTPADAQETTGRLSGRVLSESGEPLRTVTVFLSSELGEARQFRTDDRGYFTAPALRPGAFRVRVRSVGFREQVLEEVIVRLGRTTSLGDVVLQQTSATLEPVVVRFDAGRIDPISTTRGSSIDVRFAEKLPTGRDYTSILTLLPEVTENFHHRDGINIAGATGLENAWYIDGINATEGYRNGGGIRLPNSFVDHLEVKTGGYEAEFGRATGGIVGVVTRSGTNAHTQTGFTSFTSGSVEGSPGRSPYAFPGGRYSQFDAGVSFGGPIVRDRLWYFVAYDGAIAEDKVRSTNGDLVDRNRTDHIAGKLTWRPDAATDVSATFVADPSRRRMIGNAFWGDLGLKTLATPDPYVSDWDQGGRAMALTAKRLYGRNVLVEATSAYTRFTDFNAPRTSSGRTLPLVVDMTSGTWSGGHGNDWDRASSRASASLSANVQTGPHVTKFGVQFEDNRLREDWRWLSGGPDSAGVIMRVAPDGYLTLILDHQTVVNNRVASAFAQTSMVAHPRLRVNAGLRWDGQYFSSPTTQRSGSITSQWQPRLGLVASPTESGDQKITATLGRFYEQIPLQPISWFWGGLHQHFFFYDHDPRVDPSGGAPFFWDDMPGTDLRGQHFDEVTLSYERRLARGLALAMRGVHRDLREVLNEMGLYGNDPPIAVFGNPGRGQFAAAVAPIGTYDALELTLQRAVSENPAFSVSYIWSRKYGNYPGVFNQDYDNPNANAGTGFDSTAMHNALGLLSNDRTHVLKGMVAHRMASTFSAGATLQAMSGTPLTARASRNGDLSAVYFIEPRGSGGRSPFTWDLNLRGTWDMPERTTFRGGRIVLDILHLFSQRKALRIEQQQFLTSDETGPISPNPLFGTGLQFQSPTTIRVGVEFGRGGR